MGHPSGRPLHAWRGCGDAQSGTLAGLADLQGLGVLVVERRHAPRRPTLYRLDLDRLASVEATRRTWKRRSKQLVLSFPQGFAQPIAQLAEDSEVFHSFHRRTHDDLVALPDTNVTRSVKRS
jgi:hypothetical protein